MSAVKPAVFFAALLCASISQAQVYKWVDEEGNVHFGDRPPESQQQSSEEVKVASQSFSREASVPSTRPTDRSSSETSDRSGSTSRAGAEGTAELCSRAGRNFRRFVPKMESMAMERAKGQASTAELKEMKEQFSKLKRISQSEFTKECTADYASDQSAKAVADCFADSKDVMSASLCVAFSGAGL